MPTSRHASRTASPVKGPLEGDSLWPPAVDIHSVRAKLDFGSRSSEKEQVIKIMEDEVVDDDRSEPTSRFEMGPVTHVVQDGVSVSSDSLGSTQIFNNSSGNSLCGEADMQENYSSGAIPMMSFVTIRIELLNRPSLRFDFEDDGSTTIRS